MLNINDEWETPSWLIEELYAEFGFNLDLCARLENKKCVFYSKDYLNQDIKLWLNYNIEAAFMNPPFSNILPFVTKAYEDSLYLKIILLLKCDPSTKWWGVFWNYENNGPKFGVNIRFFPKRVQYTNPYKGKSSCTFPSCLVIMDRTHDK